MTTWQLKDAVYLNARGVSFAVLTTGRWDEVASLRRVHGLHPAVVLGARRGAAGRRQHGVPHLLPARRRAVREPSTGARCDDPCSVLHHGAATSRSAAVLSACSTRTPYGRGEAWSRRTRPRAGRQGGHACRPWRSDAARDRGRPGARDQPPRAAADPPRREPRGDARPAGRPSRPRTAAPPLPTARLPRWIRIDRAADQAPGCRPTGSPAPARTGPPPPSPRPRPGTR